MKRLLMAVAIAGLLTFGASGVVEARDGHHGHRSQGHSASWDRGAYGYSHHDRHGHRPYSGFSRSHPRYDRHGYDGHGYDSYGYDRHDYDRHDYDRYDYDRYNDYGHDHGRYGMRIIPHVDLHIGH